MSTTSTRERILDVAAQLFAEQGYDGTSLRAIADALGFTKAALYYHFRSKEEILLALVEPMLEIQREMHERFAAARTMEDWAAVFDWGVDVLFDNMRVLALVDRNRAPLEAMGSDNEFFVNHRGWHDRVEDAIGANGRPFADRVRLTCALGALAGFDDFGRRLLDTDAAAVKEHLRTTLRVILGLPKRPRPSRPDEPRQRVPSGASGRRGAS